MLGVAFFNAILSVIVLSFVVLSVVTPSVLAQFFMFTLEKVALPHTTNQLMIGPAVNIIKKLFGTSSIIS
jgi:hypothetical protein